MDMKLKTVGIKNIALPVSIQKKTGNRLETVASISLYVKMPRHYRETCVSTFIRVLNKYQDEINVRIFSHLLDEVKTELEAESAHMEMTFPFFLEKQAPVTKTTSLMAYKCRFTGAVGHKKDFILGIWAPITTLCPCSKEISQYGAHNQRGEVNLNVRFKKNIWIEDIIALVEAGASSQVFALLKRPDEKFVTEQAYNNPMFVEDVVRKVAEMAWANPNISWFSVGMESFESIHNHSAYAYLESAPAP